MTNLQQIQQENALIKVVVVSPYYTDQKETLELNVTSAPPLLIEGSRFSLKYLPATEQVTLPAGSTIIQDVTYSYTYDDSFRPGTYINGNYYSSWDENVGNWRHHGTMNLVVDEQNKKIVSGTIGAVMESVDNPTDTYYTLEISFSDIPSTGWGSSGIWFTLTGDDFCNPDHVSSFDETSAQADFYRILQSYTCNDNTQFEIRLSLGSQK